MPRTGKGAAAPPVVEPDAHPPGPALPDHPGTRRSSCSQACSLLTDLVSARRCGAGRRNRCARRRCRRSRHGRGAGRARPPRRRCPARRAHRARRAGPRPSRRSPSRVGLDVGSRRSARRSCSSRSRRTAAALSERLSASAARRSASSSRFWASARAICALASASVARASSSRSRRSCSTALSRISPAWSRGASTRRAPDRGNDEGDDRPHADHRHDDPDDRAGVHGLLLTGRVEAPERSDVTTTRSGRPTKRGHLRQRRPHPSEYGRAARAGPHPPGRRPPRAAGRRARCAAVLLDEVDQQTAQGALVPTREVGRLGTAIGQQLAQHGARAGHGVVPQPVERLGVVLGRRAPHRLAPTLGRQGGPGWRQLVAGEVPGEVDVLHVRQVLEQPTQRHRGGTDCGDELLGREVGALVGEGRPLAFQRAEEGVGLGAHRRRLGVAGHDEAPSAGVAAWPGRPRVRRSSFISASNRCRRPDPQLLARAPLVLPEPPRSSRRRTPRRPGTTTAPRRRSVRRARSRSASASSSWPASRSISTASPSTRSAIPHLAVERVQLPARLLDHLEGLAQLAEGPTVASLVPAGRVWARSTDMGANLDPGAAVPRHPRDPPVAVVSGAGAGLRKTLRPFRRSSAGWGHELRRPPRQLGRAAPRHPRARGRRGRSRRRATATGSVAASASS